MADVFGAVPEYSGISLPEGSVEAIIESIRAPRVFTKDTNKACARVLNLLNASDYLWHLPCFNSYNGTVPHFPSPLERIGLPLAFAVL